MTDFSFVENTEEAFDFFRIIPAVLGFCLLLSAFLPWVSTSFLGTNISGSAVDFSNKLVLYCCLGGAIGAAGSFFKEIKTRGVIYLTISLMAVVIFFFPGGGSGSSRSLSDVGVQGLEAFKMFLEVASFGFYLFSICIVVFLIWGVWLLLLPE